MKQPGQNGSAARRIMFEIFTTSPLPVGEQVFITGSSENLGRWRPDGFPLTRMDDNMWSGVSHAGLDETVEFKITRGSWDSEETLPDGRVPSNHMVFPGQAGFSHRVYNWKDSVLAPAPEITGNYRIHEGFHSNMLRYDRRVIVWLPPFYEQNKDRHYPVLYMQDGQQVFDPRTSTWNVDWGVDECCQMLILNGQMQDIIVVAVYSTEDRFLEYNPSMAGPEYGRFLLEELKPFIDREYRTLPGRGHTAIAGASMGATIAFHIAWTRPDKFFGAACLSPAFRFNDDQACLDLARNLSSLPDLKTFLYCGEGDPTEKELMKGARDMNGLLQSKGMNEEHLLFKEDAGGEHNEMTWSKYTPDLLKFLFGR
ncbi:MAG: alpha/beta hydrolase-fold protein [Lentisphaerota bacterium]